MMFIHTPDGLEAALDETGQLGEPGDTALGDVGDMRLAVERHEVVLTHRVEGNLAHHHDLLIVLLAKKGIDHFAGIAMEPVENLGVERRHSLRGLEQTFAFRVLAQRLDDLPHRLLDPALVDLSHP